MATDIEDLTQTVLINPVVKHLLAMAARAWKKRWIVTFTGPTRQGKTTAVHYADRNLPFPHRLFECKPTTTHCDLLRCVGLDASERWNTHGRSWMNSSLLRERAVERARKEPYLLIVDEADQLGHKCFEVLRSLWDDARLPILLVGNEILRGKIHEHHSRLAWRIRLQFEEKLLREADTRQTLEFMGLEVDDTQFNFLWKLVGGNPGFMQALLETGREIAESHGAPLSVDSLAGAVRYFPTLKGVI
ncbi:MAG: AAA family ATPase [Terriglobia bacterium]